MDYPLMPMATSVWLVENTTLTFEQIAAFCKLHVLQIQGIADGEVAQGIKGLDPVIHGQLTQHEITRCENDSNAMLSLSESAIKLAKNQVAINKKRTYIPIVRRQDKPNAIMWLLKNCPEMMDIQITKLIGTTKNTINLIREKKHWNYANLSAKDPVLLSICTQTELNYVYELAKKKAEDKSNVSE